MENFVTSPQIQLHTFCYRTITPLLTDATIHQPRKQIRYQNLYLVFATKKSGINHDLTHEFEKASKSLFNKAFAIKMPGLKIGGGGGKSVPQGSSANYYSTKAMWISLFGWKKLPQSGQWKPTEANRFIQREQHRHRIHFCTLPGDMLLISAA